jgi:hypothetical protein
VESPPAQSNRSACFVLARARTLNVRQSASPSRGVSFILQRQSRSVSSSVCRVEIYCRIRDKFPWLYIQYNTTALIIENTTIFSYQDINIVVYYSINRF